MVTPLVHRLSLSATGTPASGPGIAPGGHGLRRPHRRRPGPSRPDTRLKACTSVSRASIRVEVLLEHLPGAERAGPDRRRDIAGRGAARRPAAVAGRSRGLSEDPGHPEAVGLDIRRFSQDLLPVEARNYDVVAKHVDERERVGGRRHLRRCRAPPRRGRARERR